MDRKLKNRRQKTRTAHERDLMALLAHAKRSDSRVADAIVTLLDRGDAETLAALGVVLNFVATQATRGSQ